MFKAMGSVPSSFWSLLLPFLFLLALHLATMASRGRSSLVRSLVSKLEAERELEGMDRAVWYRADLAAMPAALAAKFVQLGEDEETAAFIRHSFEQSDWLFTQLYYNLAKSLLSWFYCQTDINGMLGRGGMFVVSKAQVELLTSASSTPLTTAAPLPALLDLGAGDGAPTASLAPFFEQTFVTEVSAPMRRACQARGFTVLELDAWAAEPAAFNAISALNLFDRCARPLTIIRHAHRALRQGGLLLVALVLPFRPYVESVPGHKPEEVMAVHGETFREQVESAVEVFEGEGFMLERWARVPYLCQGDLNRPLYHLDNGLFLFKRVEKEG